MKLNVKFDVIRDENTVDANTSFIKGTNKLADALKDIKDNKLELEIQVNGIIKFTEQIESVGINAIALAQGVGKVLKEFSA
jgi:hypothetical protein